MSTKDEIYRWLSSGGAYYLIAFIWFLSAIFFGFKAKAIGRLKSSENDGWYLGISTTIFAMIGGAIGLLLFQGFFPWYIFTSMAGCILAPWLVCRRFKSGRSTY